MMPEISLNLLDIAQNSVKAKAACIWLSVVVDRFQNRLTVSVKDNGCGMDEITQAMVCDPFYTTRTTRKVGLGIPFLKQAAEMTGGSFDLKSQPGVGTEVTATFVLDSIDRMPLGDMNGTLLSLLQCNPELQFIYLYQVDAFPFELDTNALRSRLGDLPLNTPEVMAFLQEYLTEQTAEIWQQAGGIPLP